MFQIWLATYCLSVNLHKILTVLQKFSHSTCIFQDLTTKRMIDNAREHGGLYYLKKEDFVNKQTQIVNCKASICLENKK